MFWNDFCYLISRKFGLTIKTADNYGKEFNNLRD